MSEHTPLGFQIAPADPETARRIQERLENEAVEKVVLDDGRDRARERERAWDRYQSERLVDVYFERGSGGMGDR